MAALVLDVKEIEYINISTEANGDGELVSIRARIIVAPRTNTGLPNLDAYLGKVVVVQMDELEGG